MSRTSIRKLIRNMPVGVIYLTDQLALKNSFILTNTSKPKDSPPTLWDLSAGFGMVQHLWSRGLWALLKDPTLMVGYLMVFQEQLVCAVKL